MEAQSRQKNTPGKCQIVPKYSTLVNVLMLYSTLTVMRRNVVPLTFSSAPSRPGLDDCWYCSRSHRLPDWNICSEVLENGEHGGQHQSHNDSDSWGHVYSCRCSNALFTVSTSFITAKPFCTKYIVSSCLGVCGIAGVSTFANMIVQDFRFTTFTDGGFSMFGGGGGMGGLTGTLTPR